jgi:hypothetical protein
VKVKVLDENQRASQRSDAWPDEPQTICRESSSHLV